jgi:hypothetical protein
MRDEMDARLWLEHGHAFSVFIANIVKEAGVALRRLNEIQYRAPWQNPCAR